MNHHSTLAAADQAAAGVGGNRWQEPRQKAGSDVAVQRVVMVA
jgi:hypothetical protein